MRHFVFQVLISENLIIFNSPFEIDVTIKLVEALIKHIIDFKDRIVIESDCNWIEIETE